MTQQWSEKKGHTKTQVLDPKTQEVRGEGMDKGTANRHRHSTGIHHGIKCSGGVMGFLCASTENKVCSQDNPGLMGAVPTHLLREEMASVSSAVSEANALPNGRKVKRHGAVSDRLMRKGKKPTSFHNTQK